MSLRVEDVPDPWKRTDTEREREGEGEEYGEIETKESAGWRKEDVSGTMGGYTETGRI